TGTPPVRSDLESVAARPAPTELSSRRMRSRQLASGRWATGNPAPGTPAHARRLRRRGACTKLPIMRSTLRWARVALVVTAAGSGACAKSPSSCVGTCPPTDGSVSVEDATRGAERDASDGVLRDLLAVERIEEPPAVCGDGLLRGAEECDDGNLASDDGCSADCKLEQKPCPFSTAKAFCDVRSAVCGDGVLSSVEACDDGNAASGDGCAADCTTVEVGWHCRVPGRRCVPICGDQLRS